MAQDLEPSRQDDKRGNRLALFNRNEDVLVLVIRVELDLLSESVSRRETFGEPPIIQQSSDLHSFLGCEGPYLHFGSVYSRPKENHAMSETDAKSIYKQGFAHFVKGELDPAIAEYRRAIEIDPGLAIAWNGLSMALAKQGQMDAAVEAAEKLVEIEPDDPLSHTNLSRILMQKGEITEAEDARAKAMGLQMRKGTE